MGIGNMAVGSILRLKIRGEHRCFRVMHHGKPSDLYDDTWLGGTILMMDWSEEPYYQSVSPGTRRNYASSSAHSWLNGLWFGYLDEGLQDVVKEVHLPYRTDTNNAPYEVDHGANGLAAKAWLPSAVEVARGSAYESDQSTFYVEEGSVFDYWKNAGAERYADWACFDDTGADIGWSIRTINKNYTGNDSIFYNVVRQDGLAASGAKQKGYLRPCLVLPSDLPVDGELVKADGNFPVKTDGVWRTGATGVKIGGIWHSVAAPAAKINGAWKQ
ncbi:MAG: hypothetical protein IKU58_06220 [Clostridia bacterium]|nr:hypothetical protein [Clostridia bacterium]